jgi:hypothetical protein
MSLFPFIIFEYEKYLLHSYNLTVVGHGFDYFDLKLTDTWCCASHKFFPCVCYNYHYLHDDSSILQFLLVQQ